MRQPASESEKTASSGLEVFGAQFAPLTGQERADILKALKSHHSPRSRWGRLKQAIAYRFSLGEDNTSLAIQRVQREMFGDPRKKQKNRERVEGIDRDFLQNMLAVIDESLRHRPETLELIAQLLIFNAERNEYSPEEISEIQAFLRTRLDTLHKQSPDAYQVLVSFWPEIEQ
jgi:uncharacterized coiled-coil DUF342 family protein